jgi:hypothetical protein
MCGSPSRFSHRDPAARGLALREPWTIAIRRPKVRLMGIRRSHVKVFGLLATSLVLAGAVVVWMFRRWTDHDVSDPGVTL